MIKTLQYLLFITDQKCCLVFCKFNLTVIKTVSLSYLQQITASELHETLIPIVEAFHDRVKYLNCAVGEATSNALADLQPGNTKSESRSDEVKLTSKR